MQTPPNPFRAATLRRLAGGALALVPLLASCAATTRSGIGDGCARWPEVDGRETFIDAHVRWKRACGAEDAYRDYLACIGNLQRAQAVDPLMPLYASQEGWVRLEYAYGLESEGREDATAGERWTLERDSQERAARAAFERSLELCGDWVPGLIGLAILDRREGDPEAARRALLHARAILADVAEGATAESITSFRLRGRERRAGEPLDSAERMRLMRGLFAETERWISFDAGVPDGGRDSECALLARLGRRLDLAIARLAEESPRDSKTGLERMILVAL